jgi:hypothetical protein
MGKKIIKRNGMTVYAYGDYSKFDNVAIIGQDLSNESEIETTMENNSDCDNWTQVVEEVTAWGKRNNCEIDEVYCI